MAGIFFIYGLAFFCLGLALAIYPRRGSSFSISNKLWLIAVFGLVHGINEWVDMFILLNGPETLPYLKLVRVPMLVISFYCLLLFGIKSLTRDGERYKALKFAPAALLAIWAVIVAASGNRFLMADVWGRYLLGAPGILLTSYALTLHEAQLRDFGLYRAQKFMRLSAIVFFLYGVFSGFVVPDAGFFPNSFLNYNLFLEHFGVPVQVFRTACAVVLTYGFVNILGIFEWETKDELRKSYDNLESRVKERTAELIDTNEELELEISERIKAEENLKQSQKNIEAILESTPYGIVLVGRDKTIRYVNSTALKIMGYESHEQILGSICHKNICPADVGKCPIIDLKHRVDRSERILIKADRSHLPILKSVVSVTLDGEELMLEAFVDISERKRAEQERAKLEEQLVHAQKMEAIGTLTGGIAHDFNNILTAVIGYGEFLQEDIHENDPRRAYVDMIVSAGSKGAKLTQSLLAFSRKQIIHPRPIDLNNIVRSAEGLLSRLIGEDIELKISLSDRRLVVEADSIRMEQVLMNLATNARDAMPNGGALIINTEAVDLDEEFVRVHGFGLPGPYALVTAADTGQGMDEDTKNFIFEPFFTTKGVGKGTGLGLSVVYGLIRQQNGFISVYSELGTGTTFKIYMPMIDAEVGESKAAAPAETKEGTETILLAEDDESVRGLMKKVLEKAGYTIIEASDGEEALKLWKEYSDKIQLLVFDMVMPVKSGLEAYEEIKKLNPNIRALFVSGYPSEVLRKRGVEDVTLNLITKPISPNEILAKIREVLDR